MIKTKKTKYYTLGIIALSILAVLVVPNLIVSTIDQITKSGARKLEKNPIVEVVSTSVNGRCPSPYQEITANTPIDTALNQAGLILYCVEHGVPFMENSDGTSISEMQPTYGNVYGSSVQWYKHHDHVDEVSLGYSNPLLWCVRNHQNYANSNYNPGAAYTISYPDVRTWTEEKQYALWGFGVNHGPWQVSGGSLGGNNVYNEGVHYKEFNDQTTENGSKSALPDIKAEDQTDINKVTVKANNKEQTLTVGPFSIDYIYGAYQGVAFGGISDMYLIGYNSKDQIIKERIEIKKYIDPDGIGHEPKFFEPQMDDGSYVDRKEQVYPKGKSAGEETFQLQIDNPNAGLAGDASEDLYVAKVKVHIKFQWMSVVDANICSTEAKMYSITWFDHRDPWNCDHLPCSGCKTSSGTNPDGSTWTSSYCDHVCTKMKCYDCYKKSKLDATDVQDHISVLRTERKLFETEMEIDVDKEHFSLTMDLGGKVWEDKPDGKESLTDGKYTENDRVIPNVKVTLYTEDGKIATLLSNSQEGKSDADVMSRVNPTYTDEKGDYLFKGIDPLKKYYVQFEYNGQVYLPTDYEKNDGAYNQVDWFWTSKGTEKPGDRDSYDQTYSEIGSAPANYKVPSGSMQIAKLTNGYNEAFSQYDLMGFKLDEDGNYYEENRLIDGFYIVGESGDEKGRIIETDVIKEGEISKAIKEFIKTNKKSPTENDMLGIYKKIARDEETLRKLQFIKDTKIESYTQAMNAGGYDLYPIYDEFVINKTIDMKYETAEEARSLEYDLTEETIDGAVYKPIYPGQFYINQGLWRRQEVDLALRKDVLYAATRINGKTEVYSYNKRQEYTDEQKAQLREARQKYEQGGRTQALYQQYLDVKNQIEQANMQEGTGGYWQIQLRMRDYNNYYSGVYTKELYEADYKYRSTATNKAGTDKDLQLYVTYKITVRNVSQSILGEITEVVDYYDADYTYRDDLSWVMYKGDSNSDNLDEINFTESDYYDSIDKNESGLSKNIADKNKANRGSGGTKSDKVGTYETARSGECRSDVVEDYQAVYVKGLEGKKLASGEEAYIYLTFEVNKTGGKIITDTDDSLKYNYAEINGYKTYYKDGTSLPNGVTKGSGDVAGLIDINSTPGNLCRKDIEEGGKYEKNFENDTDRAKGVKVVVKEDFIRSINGTVWEDERTHNVSNTNAMIGNGIRTEGEVGINGVTVELVERLEDGSQFIWQRTVSGSGTGQRINVEDGHTEEYSYEFIDNGRGKYEFSHAITGNYFVRFRYGDTTRTVNTDKNGGQNKTSYNGQDFKSTVYQKNMENSAELDGYEGYTGMRIDQYNGEYNGTSVGYYDIREADKNSNNFSDAKDLWNNAEVSYVTGRNETLIGRQQVMNYSNNNGNGVTNELAEILASPYTEPYNNERIEALRSNTQMTAVTGLIVLEGEYNRTDTDGFASNSNNNGGKQEYLNGNDLNGKYMINYVDFGLTERPKAQLELGKKITNVQIKLANGNILFDANDKMTDLLWTRNQSYELNKVGMDKLNSKKYQEFYGLDNHRYTYRTQNGRATESVNSLVANKYKQNGNNGLIVATMDEELMQGANITISYLLTVTNVGETDYYNAEQEKAFAQRGTGESFYYKGTGTNTIVRTKADVVTDYVANNLNFREDAKNNNEDSTTNKENGWKITNNVLTTLGLNNNLGTKVAQYNDVIHTNNLNKDLAPTENTTVGLVLTQLINPENSTDDKTYDNIAEITTISNPVGRRMAYSIQGNQDPTATPAEVDSVKSERVTILPPFGSGNTVVYIAIAATVLVILAGGIILIKKKVLDR